MSCAHLSSSALKTQNVLMRFLLFSILSVLSTAVPIDSATHRTVSLDPLENDLKVVNNERLSDDLLQDFENQQLTFKEAVKIASEKGASIDWAYQYHDPSKDNYAIVKEWLKMKDLKGKDELKEKMMLNPTLRKLFEWTGGLDATQQNLRDAVVSGNLDIVKYLIAVRVKATGEHLMSALSNRTPDIVKYLIEIGKVKPTGEHLDLAIYKVYIDQVYQIVDETIHNERIAIIKYLINRGKIRLSGFNTPRYFLDWAIKLVDLDMIKILVEEGKFKPNGDNLNFAIGFNNLDIVKYLVEVGKVKPAHMDLSRAIYWDSFDMVKYFVEVGNVKITQEDLDDAVGRCRLDIVKYLVQNGNVKPTTDHLNRAVANSRLDIIKYLINEGNVKPTQKHLNDSIQRGDQDIAEFLRVVLEG